MNYLFQFPVGRPPWRPIACTTLCWLAWAQFTSGDVVLNEIMADNRQAVANGERFPDYIELANRSGSPVGLGGWSLTDDPLNPRRFVFSQDVSIPAGGYLLVWCDVADGAPGLHAGFALGAKGERVQLYSSDGLTLVDEVSFGLQAADLSVGRIPDGTGPWALTRPTPGEGNQAQVMGAKNQVRINEWMARPSAGNDWIELFNRDDLPVALAGAILTDSLAAMPANRPIPALSFIGGRGFVQMFASDLDQPDADHLDFKLGATGETLTLYDSDRATVLDKVTFGEQSPDLAQGRAPDGGTTLLFFPLGRATPGEPNFAEVTSVVISEVLTHTDPPLEDAIELRNTTAAAVDISHWWLSDAESNLQKYRIPEGTVIPPSGFVVFYEYQFNSGENPFSLDSAEGDQVFLSAGDASGQLTGQQTFVKFGPLFNGVSVGRVPTSVGVDFVPLSARTFGVDNPSTVAQFRLGTGMTNAGPRIGPIVITEIYPGGAGAGAEDADEFVELHNPTTAPEPLFDLAAPTNAWRLRDGISFDFPLQVTIPAGGYVLVVNFDPGQNPVRSADFRSRFNVPDSALLVGPFAGHLSKSGEAIALLRPDEPQGPDHPNAGLVPYQLVERIDYLTAAPWPALGNAGISSLHRPEPLAYGNDPTHWISGAPTPGRAAAGGDLDADSDSMPDAWELAHGLSPSDPADATIDGDHDGANNLEEYRAGTDPRDPQSVLRITAFQKSGESLRFAFEGVQGKKYTLEAASTIGNGRWLSVTNTDALTSGRLEFEVPAHSSATPVYRLKVPVEP